MKHKTDKIRWGIVGLGNVVTSKFAPALARSKRSIITACSTRSLESARQFAQKNAVWCVHETFDQLANDPDVDIVYLATPNSMHYEQAKLALQCGKHVLCEKPLALTVAEGNELICTASRAKRLLKVAYQFRFEHLFERAREHILAGGLGELRSVRLFGCAASAVRSGGWRQDPAEGGILSDLGIHLLDLVSWITGLGFTHISARAHPSEVGKSAVQTISILGTLGQDCHCMISATRQAPYGQNSFAVEGTQGTLFNSDWRGIPEVELTIVNADGRRIEKLMSSPMFEREIEAFEDELAGKCTILATAEDGLRAIVLADAVRASAVSGRSIIIDEREG